MGAKDFMIGKTKYMYKKDALIFYKTILNSYKFGESLTDQHFNDIVDLLNYDFELSAIEDNDVIVEGESELNDELIINDIRIAKVQFNTKCFELVYDDFSTGYISYIHIINRPKITAESNFNTACRNAVQQDLIDIKQEYFKNHSKQGLVKCQESNQLSKWEELAVDHRQPNTFSIIVDRFKEVSKMNIRELEFVVDQNNFLHFRDEELIAEFRSYHKNKANLRVVRKEVNLSRTGMARIKTTNRDLRIK